MQTCRRKAAELLNLWPAQLQHLRGKKTKARTSVCLKEDVPGLGMAGDVVSVKHGFARNALLPSRLGMTQPKSSSVGLTSPAALSAQNLSAVLTQLTSSPPVELVVEGAADEESSGETLSAAEVVQAVLTQKKIVLAEEYLIMSPEATLLEGSYQIPLRFTIPGSAEKPMLSLLIKRAIEAQEPSIP